MQGVRTQAGIPGYYFDAWEPKTKGSNGTTSGITGPVETPSKAGSSPTGQQPGPLTVAVLPRTAEEAGRLDAGKMSAQVAVWCEELEEFPLYVIRKACKWAKRVEGTMPSLAAFLRRAIGSDVLARKRVLQQWLT